MTVSNESREFFAKLSKIWSNFKDYTYLEGIKLSPEQLSIIEHEEDQLLIEGYAGTGKSLTLLYKFINVMIRERGKKVLFVTFNKTLIDDTKKRLKGSKEYMENKDNNQADIMTFHEMSTKVLKELKVIEYGIGRVTKENLEKLKGDALRRVAGILSKYTEAESEIYKGLTKEERLYVTHNRNFVSDEIAWIKAMGFVDLEKYVSTERTGRNKSVRLTRNQRKTIFKIYEDYQKELSSNKFGLRLDLEDYALKLVNNEFLISDEVKYDYIFVDEVQDLDPMQIMALCRLTKKSIVLSGDAKQRIYKKCPVKYEDLGLNIRQKGKRKVLNKNYRSTGEIVRLANSLNFYDDEKLDEKHFVKQGERPIIHRTSDLETAVRYIANQIKKTHEEDPYKTVAIIHREELKPKTGWKSDFRVKLEQLMYQSFTDINSYYKKFDYEEKKQIFYTNAYDVKGLEFDVVFIVDFNNRYYPHIDEINKIKESNDNKDIELISDDILEFVNTEKKLLYVAMTRAKEKLYLIANSCPRESNISEFICDFEPKDYKASGFTKESIEKKKVSYDLVGNGKLYKKIEREKQVKISNEFNKEMKANIEPKKIDHEVIVDDGQNEVNELLEILNDGKVESLQYGEEKIKEVVETATIINEEDELESLINDVLEGKSSTNELAEIKHIVKEDMETEVVTNNVVEENHIIKEVKVIEPIIEEEKAGSIISNVIEAKPTTNEVVEQRSNIMEEMELKAVKNTIVEVKPVINNEDKETVTSQAIEKDVDIIETVIKPLLTKHKIKFIDNRAKKGAFWIIGGQEIKELIRNFSRQGLMFIFAKNGGRATGKKPAWYLRG